jgi:hypothetical protein
VTATARGAERDAVSDLPPRRSRPRLGTAGVALLTALLALASGTIGLVFDLWPELRPDPRTTRSAEVSVVAVERAVPFDDWLRRVTPTRKAYAARRRAHLRRAFAGMPRPTPADARAVLALRGQLIYVRMRIEGFKRRSLRLRWSMYRVTGQRRLATEGLQNATGASVVGAAPSDTSVVLIWTPAVAVRGALFARFEVVDKAGTVLAVADSRRFPGLRR